MLMFVSGYSRADQAGIMVYRWADRAQPTLVGAIGGVINPSFVVIHPNGRWVYAVSETNADEDGVGGSVWAWQFAADAQTLAVQSLNEQPSAGNAPCHLRFDQTGRWLLVSNYLSGTVAVLPIGSDGALGPSTDVIQHHGRGVRPQQDGPHAHSATFSPDNRFVIVADLGIDQLLVYAFDAVAGKLTLHSQIATPDGSGPRHLVFHPDGSTVYVVHELASEVSVHGYDATHGTLHQQQIIATLPPDAIGDAAADIQITADGTRLYVSNRGPNTITAFAVESNRRLTWLASAPCGGDWPRNLALSPGDDFLLAANQRSGDVQWLPIQTGSLEIGEPQLLVAHPQVSCIALLN